MVKEGKIGAFEATWMLVAFCSAKMMLMFPRSMIDTGGCAGWIIPIISSLTGLLGLYIIISLLKRFPGQTIVEAGQSAAGPIVGFIAAMFYLAFFIVSVSMVSREFSESLKVLALPITPLNVILILVIIAIALCVFFGLETMSRMSILIVISTLVLIVIVILFLFADYNINYLFPLLGKGPTNLFLWGIIKSSNFSELLFAGLIVNSLRGWENTFKAGRNAILLSTLAMTVVVSAVIMTFGSNMGDSLYFPAFRLTKEIHFGRFFQRAEPIFLLFWMLSGLLYCAIGLYASIITFTRMCKLSHYKPLIPAFAIIIFTLAQLPHDLGEIFRLDSDVLRNSSWVPTFVVPLVILIIAAIRGKKTKKSILEE